MTKSYQHFVPPGSQHTMLHFQMFLQKLTDQQSSLRQNYKASFLKFLFQDNGHFRIFLQKGGLVNLPSGNGFFPLHLAAFKGDSELVSLLMDNMTPEDINHPGFGGCSALHVAVLMGHLPVVSVLASKGASLIVRKIF